MPLIARRPCSTHDNSNQSFMPILSLLVEETSIWGKKFTVPSSKNKVYNTVLLLTTGIVPNLFLTAYGIFLDWQGIKLL